jgi:F0F1-type ATP synthase membrane subunit b/b'
LLLSRAQDLADHLRSDVEAEAAAMRAEASAAHDEARRALIDASNVHQDAISAQRSAQARLKEAQDEAAQLVADAADQATLVADAANLTTESLLASTQVEADEIRGAAMAEDLRLRGLATTELEGHGRRTRYCCPRRRRRSNPGSYGPAPSCGNWTRRPPSA